MARWGWPCAGWRQGTITLLAMAFGGATIGASVNIMAPNLTRMARSFDLDDVQRDVVLGGWMNAAFFLVGAPCSLLFGILADRASRLQLFSAMLAVNAAACVIFAFTTAPWQCLALRVVMGAVFGSLNPVLFSAVGDLVPPAQRSAVSSYMSLAVGGGTAVGQLISGALSSLLTWRAAYLTAGAAAGLAYLCLLSWAREPARGGVEYTGSPAGGGVTTTLTSGGVVSSPAAVGGGSTSAVAPLHTAAGSLSPPPGSAASADTLLSPPSSVGGGDAADGGVAAGMGGSGGVLGGSEAFKWSELRVLVSTALGDLRIQVRRIFAVRTNAVIFLQGLFGTIPWSVITVFLSDYLAQEKGLTIPQATFLVLLFGLGAAVGGVVGGTVIGQRLYRASPKYLPLFCGAAQTLSTLPVLWLINGQLVHTDSHGTGLNPISAAAYPVAVTAGLVASMTGPNLKAMLMNVNPPNVRGAVFTLATITDSVSKGLAPTLIGLAIAWAAATRAVDGGVGSDGGAGQAGPGDGVRAWLFTVAMSGWAVSGALIASGYAWLEGDEAAVAGKAAAA